MREVAQTLIGSCLGRELFSLGVMVAINAPSWCDGGSIGSNYDILFRKCWLVNILPNNQVSWYADVSVFLLNVSPAREIPNCLFSHQYGSMKDLWNGKKRAFERATRERSSERLRERSSERARERERESEWESEREI